jgi:hypothetical protein
MAQLETLARMAWRAATACQAQPGALEAGEAQEARAAPLGVTEVMAAWVATVAKAVQAVMEVQALRVSTAQMVQLLEPMVVPGLQAAMGALVAAVAKGVLLVWGVKVEPLLPGWLAQVVRLVSLAMVEPEAMAEMLAQLAMGVLVQMEMPPR